MNQFSFKLLVGLLLIVGGVNGLSSMATRAVVAGCDGSVVNSVYSAKRLALAGIVGSNVASRLIQCGENIIVRDNAVRSSRQAQDQTPPFKVDK